MKQGPLNTCFNLKAFVRIIRCVPGVGGIVSVVYWISTVAVPFHNDTMNIARTERTDMKEK